MAYNQIRISIHVVTEIPFEPLLEFDTDADLTTCLSNSINLQEEAC